MVRHWILGVVLAGACISMAVGRQGSVRTRDGRNIEGDVVEKDEAVTITTRGGTVSIARSDVANIEYARNVRELYEKRLAELPKDAGAKAHYDLGKWLYEAKEYDLARKELDKALALEPNNAEASLLRQTVDRQMIWDRSKLPSGTLDPKDPKDPKRGPAKAPGTAEKKEFLDADQINIIRQAELRDGDRVRVKLERDVVKRFVDYEAINPRDFATLPDAAKAYLILSRGTPEMRADVKILEDPMALAQFKRQIQPTILSGCASSSCHGGTGGGSFVLHSGGTANEGTTYTNFYILTQYQFAVGETAYRAIDRVQPRSSLLLQYGLPREQAEVKHPATPGWTAAFRGANDPKYQTLAQWLAQTLKPVAPDYRIDLPLPGAKTAPATRPAAK